MKAKAGPPRFGSSAQAGAPRFGSSAQVGPPRFGSSAFFFALLPLSALGHSLLTLPSSKNAGNASVASLPPGTHFALASFGIIDKAFFDGDHGLTPWTRPGEFDHVLARDLIPGHPQFLHPCGCNAGGPAGCAGVDVAVGFGETTLGAAPGVPPRVTPPKWERGGERETGWNAFANHGGGYLYALCRRATFDACRDAHFPGGPAGADEAQKEAYLRCVWDCFESTTLEWVPDSQRVQYGDDACTYVEMNALEKTGRDGRVWRYVPVPDYTQVTLKKEGRCTWESVRRFSSDAAEEKFEASFGSSDVCDTGPDAHNPKKWNFVDRVRVPDDIPTGEYLLSWRWDAFMADQMWTNCADVEIVPSSSDPAEPVVPECPPAPTRGPVAAPSSATPTAPMSPSPTRACEDFALPGNWGQQGEYDCAYYEGHGGVRYCDQTVINTACCFCGGGSVSRPVARPSAPPATGCADAELPGNWGAGGIYDCDHYEDHGGAAYCAHTVIKISCCFCGGGVRGGPTARPTARPMERPTERPNGAGMAVAGDVGFVLSKMKTTLSKEEVVAVLDVVRVFVADFFKTNKMKKKIKARFENLELEWRLWAFEKKKKHVVLNATIRLSFSKIESETAPPALEKVAKEVEKIMDKKKKKIASAVKDLDAKLYKKLKTVKVKKLVMKEN